jgi:putative transposase
LLCDLLTVSRSSFYYQPAEADESELREAINQLAAQFPTYGSRRLAAQLRRAPYKLTVNRKRVQRVMREEQINCRVKRRAIQTTDSKHAFPRYPNLVADLEITRPDQVWVSDITYVRLLGGFVYLVAVIDWYSRYVLSWEVSTTLESEFCVSALNQSLQVARPEIFNTDQGSQFTSNTFTGILKEREIAISMDGRGRALDNIFVERLWRSVKYEDVYIRDYETAPQAIAGLGRYFKFYNGERLHQSLDYKTPEAVYRLTA